MLNAQRKLIETIEMEVESRFLKVGDYSIHYITSGSGEPLLLSLPLSRSEILWQL